MIEVLPPEFSAENPADHARREEAAARERRPIVVGLIGTLVFHLFVFILAWLSPRWVAAAHGLGTGAPDELGEEKELLIELAKDADSISTKAAQPQLTPEQQQMLEPEQYLSPRVREYIGINPLAPVNEPDHAQFESSQSQQAAQLEEGTDNSPIGRVVPNTPFKDYSDLVSGVGTVAPIIAPPPGQNGRGDSKDQHEILTLIEGSAVILKAQTPLPGFEKIIGDAPNGIGTNIGSERKGAQDTERTVEGEKSGTEENLVAVGGVNQQRMIAGAPGRPGPRPRPRLREARPAILRDQPQTANRSGEVGADATATDYGTWMAEFREIVGAYFDRHCEEIANYPPSGSKVMIRFRMNSKGEITQIVDVREDVGPQWTYACLDSLQAPAPFKPWPKDMVEKFGDEMEREYAFRFDY